MKLEEVKRSELLNKSKKGASYKDQSKGKNRYERRKLSKISTSVQNYNRMNMNSLFKQDILTVVIEVYGETGNYTVKIKFGGILAELSREIEHNNGVLEYKCIHRALMTVFNSGNVYCWCSCEDFKYRFNHWSFKNDYAIDKGNRDPGPGKGIANPNDDKGAGCKHILLVLANVDWLMKVASTVFNYINYMKEHQENLYAKLMFPKLYGMPYDKAVQLDLFDNQRNYLKHNKGLLSKSNKAAVDKTLFKKGNKQGMRFTSNKEEPAEEDELKLDLEN